MSRVTGSCRLAQMCLLLASALAFASNTPSVGEPIWVRLSSPLSTYSSHRGEVVHAVLTQNIYGLDGVVFQAGTEVVGTVRAVRKVGWGIRHETAALELQFNELSTAEGYYNISASVAEVENAREEVKHGVIQGIRSSKTAQGQINSRLAHLPTWNPYSDIGLILFKAAFPIFPEPEIYLPAGTDLRLELTSDLSRLPSAPGNSSSSDIDQADFQNLRDLGQSLPRYSTTVKRDEADLINLVFVGSEQQVASAFYEAGWNTSDAYTKRAVMRDFYAFLNESGYAQAPMRPLLLEGKPADMNWQKSLNSYAKRDHLRIWQWPTTNGTGRVWVSSSTHDTTAGLSVKYHRFVHHISPDIDEERGKVIRDLSVAGCVKTVVMVPRRGVANLSQNAVGDIVRTDGAIAVVELQDCRTDGPGPSSSAAEKTYKPGNIVFRYMRRQILTFRSDIWRANIIYGLYDLGSMTVTAMRHHPALPPPSYLTGSRMLTVQAANQSDHHNDQSRALFPPTSQGVP